MANVEALTLKDTSWRPAAMILLGVAIGSTAPIIVRHAQAEGVPSLVIAAARLSLAALFLTPMTLGRYSAELRALSLKDWLFAAIAGITLALHFITFFGAFENTSILVAGVLTGSSPLLVALIEVFILKGRLHRVVWLGLFLALVGGTIIGISGGSGSAGGSNPILGDALALVSAGFVAVHLIIGRSLRSHTRLLPYLWLVFGFAGSTALLAILITGTPILGYSSAGYTWLLLLTIGPQLIGISAFNYSLAFFPATFISISGQLVTVASAIMAFFLFAEIPLPLQILGSTIIVFGVILASKQRT
jgi:drug/metabolite transporter (DMT)-like permease